MRDFLDPRDEGTLALTHIYLLIGCAIPVWCTSALGADALAEVPPLLPFAGLLSVGVQDSLAAVFGTYCGRHRWPGTTKTVEGTLGAAAVTFACASLLSTHVAAMNSPAAKVYESLIPIAAVGLLEAYTQQIDNVVLPVVFSTLVLVL